MRLQLYSQAITEYGQAQAVAPNLNYQGQHQAARAQLQSSYDIARNNGERRGYSILK